jgi:hypothetical protein
LDLVDFLQVRVPEALAAQVIVASCGQRISRRVRHGANDVEERLGLDRCGRTALNIGCGLAKKFTSVHDVIEEKQHLLLCQSAHLGKFLLNQELQELK